MTEKALYVIYNNSDNFDIVNLTNDSTKVNYDMYLFNIKRSGAGYDFLLNQEGNLVTKLSIIDDSSVRHIGFMDYKTASPILVDKRENKK